MIDVRIPHLVGRVSHVDRLLAELDRPGFAVRVLCDDPTPEDMDSAQRRTKIADNLTRCWSDPFESGCTHVLVLEDDAILARDGAEAILEVAKRWPDDPVGLFCHRGYTGYAVAHGAAYAVHNCYSGGVAQMLPVALAAEFDAFHRVAFAHEPWMSVDGRLSRFVQRRGYRVIFPAPSIVEHDADLVSSYAFHGRVAKKVRAARSFPAGVSALGVDWANGAAIDVEGRIA